MFALLADSCITSTVIESSVLMCVSIVHYRTLTTNFTHFTACSALHQSPSWFPSALFSLLHVSQLSSLAGQITHSSSCCCSYSSCDLADCPFQVPAHPVEESGHPGVSIARLHHRVGEHCRVYRRTGHESVSSCCPSAAGEQVFRAGQHPGIVRPVLLRLLLPCVAPLRARGEQHGSRTRSVASLVHCRSCR